MGGANPNQAPGPTAGERIAQDLEKGGGVLRDNQGNIIASQRPVTLSPFILENGDRFNYDRHKAELQMEQERQREADLQRQREYELAKAREAEAKARESGGASPPFRPSYTFTPITPPGVSDTPGVPGTGRSPFAGRPSRSQQDNQIELQRATQERARQMEMFQEQMAQAQQQEALMRAQAERNRAARGMEGSAGLEEERRRRTQDEEMFNRRLQEAGAQAQAMSRRPNRADVSAGQRQAEMISEFERARSEGKNYDISQFEARFGPQTQAGITAPVPGEEGQVGILSYQELLDRLKRYQSGGI
jgi:hypothetical protein